MSLQDESVTQLGQELAQKLGLRVRKAYKRPQVRWALGTEGGRGWRWGGLKGRTSTFGQKWARAARAGPEQRGLITGDLLSLLAESPGPASRTVWERKEQPKRAVCLTRQLLRPVPSLALADLNTQRWPELTLVSFGLVFSNNLSRVRPGDMGIRVAL